VESAIIKLNIVHGQSEEAVALLELKARWTIEVTGRPNGDVSDVFACLNLGCLYEQLGNLAVGEEYYRLALEWRH
jgi:hypothetical protein